MVLFEQASNTFYVTMDTVHAAAITAMIVPLLTMKVYLRDFPARRADMALQPLTACVLSPPEWYLGVRDSVCVCMCVSLTVYTCVMSLCACDVILFPQHRMDLMLCRCRMWAPPTSLCLGTCQLTVMASSSTSVCIAMVLWRVSCPLL